MKKYRSLWALLAVLLVAALVVTACTKPAVKTPVAGVEPPADSKPVDEKPADEKPADEKPAEDTKPAEDPKPAGDIDCTGVNAGDTVTMLYQWSGVEEEKLTKILTPWMEACGITVSPEASRDQALLDTRIQAGTPPDVAFWQTTQLIQYKDKLIDLATLGAKSENYAGYWKDIGTLDGKWIGLPVKADPKTLVWYSPKLFKEAGYEVPTNWAELDALVEKMVADGKVPWSMGMESGDATGWTGTDFIQDILLVTKGPGYVNDIISGKVAYDDAGVKEAYEIYGKWAKDEKYTVAGAEGTVSIGFVDAILKVFSDTPEAMMVKQSGFAGGEITNTYGNLVYGTDFDFFGVPGAQGLQGGSDWLMAFNDTPAVRSLVKYLSSDKGGQTWAEIGFDLTPNAAGATAYTDPQLLKKAEILANAKGFTPDIGDSIPGGFGSAEFKGITDFVNGAELDTVLETITKAQKEALSQ